MKILIVFPFSRVSTGISSYTFSIIDALNHSDNIFCELASNHKEWKNDVKVFRKLRLFPFFNFFSKILILLCQDKVLLKFNMFFFQLNGIKISQYKYVFFTTAIPLFHIKSAKNVVSVHDLMHKYEPRFKEASNFLVYNYRERLYKLIGLNAKMIVVDSYLGKKQFIDSYKISDTKIIKTLPFIAPNYIYDFIDSSSKPTDREDFIFYPASFWPHKNHLNLLKAIMLLKQQNYYLKLVLCGKKNSFRKRIEKFIKENKINEIVTIHDYLSIDELVDFYKKSHALIMPTFFGPTNIPPIEALLLNCPIIVSNNYAMEEQFGKAAIYINPDSVSSIVDGIKRSFNFNPEDIDIVKKKFTKELFFNRLNLLIN